MAEEGPEPPFPATSGRRRPGACDIRSRPHWVSHKGYAKEDNACAETPGGGVVVWWCGGVVVVVALALALRGSGGGADG